MKTPPYCILPSHHRARAYTHSSGTNIAATIKQHREQHTPPPCHSIGDDYDDVERTAYLETPGAFK